MESKKQTIGFLIALLVSFNLITGPLAARQEAASPIYHKREVRIPMRDGVTLHTTIYSPGDDNHDPAKARYPILLNRTPYGCSPYGAALRDPIMYNANLVQSGYIFVYQDLRSRSMSDGDPIFENLRPAYSRLKTPIEKSDAANVTDEITDCEDTVHWLLKNIKGHNGKVGLYGSSYMGYTALLGAASAHPNVKAMLSASPSIDIYFEDFNRNGLFTLAYVPILDWFGTPKTGRHEGPWWKNNLQYWADGKRFGMAKDSYAFYLQQGALSNFEPLIPDSNYFWKSICEHPNYDAYRQQRDASRYLEGIACPTLIVGGWHDEQNLYGPLKAFKTIREINPDTDCRLFMGPWSHGDHKRTAKPCRVGNIVFGEDLIEDYQRNIEFRFFEFHLKGKGIWDLPRQQLFNTGTLTWSKLDSLPTSQTKRLYLSTKEGLNEAPPQPNNKDQFFEFISDPSKPVPYIEDDDFHLFPSTAAMTGDQRFASKRPDVLTFVTLPLEKDLQVIGPLSAKLKFSTSESDADLIVKLIDVYPMDRQPQATDPAGVKMNGYQRMVRFGQIRARYRKSYERPEPMAPNQWENVTVELLDVHHTFHKGHRLMVQVQSSMFPLFDRNPQHYVPNIYHAVDADFRRAVHRVHLGSYLEFQVTD